MNAHRESTTTPPVPPKRQRTGFENALLSFRLVVAMVIVFGIALLISAVISIEHGDAAGIRFFVVAACLGIVVVTVVSMRLRSWWWLILTTGVFALLTAGTLMSPDLDSYGHGWFVGLGGFAIANGLSILFGAWLGRWRSETLVLYVPGETRSPKLHW